VAKPARTLIENLRIGTTWANVTQVVPKLRTFAHAGLGLLALLSWRRYGRG
jgi:hypothetical protein